MPLVARVWGLEVLISRMFRSWKLLSGCVYRPVNYEEMSFNEQINICFWKSLHPHLLQSIKARQNSLFMNTNNNNTKSKIFFKEEGTNLIVLIYFSLKSGQLLLPRHFVDILLSYSIPPRALCWRLHLLGDHWGPDEGEAWMNLVLNNG